ncbi:MAG: acetyl-CoA hydrolase [Acidobacteriota bacterium]|nr:acetyl-CoA hydrolase [Acidobacteriota bacterium]
MTLLAYADGADSPRSAPAVAGGTGGEADRVLLGWTLDERPWLGGTPVRGWTVMAGYALRGPVDEGRIGYLPIRLSAVPRLLTDTLVPDVAVVTAVRRGSELVFGPSVGWGPALARSAASVVVEIDEEGMDLGGPPVPGRIAATVVRPPSPTAVPQPRRPDDIDALVGRQVASVLPEGATLQVGPGGIADGVLAAIDRPISIASGLVSDAVAELDRRGLLVGAAEAAYAWGGAPLHRLAAEGKLVLRPVEETHDLTRISARPRFVACNTALQVGLDGSVNVEIVSGRRVAGIGGHADFATAAVRSPGGLSVIALRSTTRRGASTIVGQVEVVSTPRCDVDMVVTEHGVADLRGADDGERAARLIAVAAPEHRRALGAISAG